MTEDKSLPKPEKSLLFRFPLVAHEWDFENNGTLKPEHVTAYSNKKVSWKCNVCEHRWEAIIANRTTGRGCPCCAGKLPILGKSDLVSTHPEIANQWDYEANGNLKPEQFTAGSGKKVHWKCPICDNRWKTKISHRTRGSNCPRCAHTSPIIRKYDLVSTHPEISNQWDYEANGDLKPEQFIAGSGKEVYWKCNACNQSWKAAIVNRTKRKGCPYCSGRLPIIGKSDLASTHSEIASQWDYEANGGLKPEQFTAGSGKRVQWKCPVCDNHWKAKICNRTYGYGCPYCVGKLPIIGKSDLLTTHPEIANQWDYEANKDLKPEQFTAGSNKKVSWKCSICEHRWEAIIANRTTGKGCPYCAGKLPIIGKSDLVSTHPEIASQWDYESNGDLKPEQFTAGSTKAVYWKCSVCSNNWKTRIIHRTQGHNCPYCSGRLPIIGKSDLVSTHPEIANLWDYESNGDLKPEQFTAGSGKRVAWKCNACNHRWRGRIYARVRSCGCPKCHLSL